MAFTMVCISRETPVRDSASANGFGSQWVDLCACDLFSVCFGLQQHEELRESCVPRLLNAFVCFF